MKDIKLNERELEEVRGGMKNPYFKPETPKPWHHLNTRHSERLPMQILNDGRLYEQGNSATK
jgi:hypothetical protein